MYAGLGVFSMYGEPYTQKKTLFRCVPKRTTMDGLKNWLDHENLKKLHEMGRGKGRTWEITWIEQGRISLDDAPGIRVESFELKCTMLGKNFKWYGIFKFFTIYKKNWNFLPTFYSFLPFLTILDHLN